VIDRFKDVLDLIQRNDFDRLYDRLEPLPDIEPSTVEKAMLAA